jgi:hypothetical protein
MLRRFLVAVMLGLMAATAAQAQSNDPSFRIVNNTQMTVNEVYASPSTDRSWGHDRMGTEVIRPGATHIVRLPPGDCTYDIRVVYQGGRSEERRGVNTCNITDFVLGGGGAAQPAPARPQAGGTGNPSFNLVNQSGRVIEEFYASPTSQQNWGPDRLGNDTVGPNSRFAVRLPQGECLYDLRIVFQGGEAREQRRVDACNVVDYVVR